ncbi:hypothetical protein [Anaerotignum faecicola]
MRTLEEVKKDSKNYKPSKTVGPSKEDVFYQKYLAAKPKVAGGTVNPIISTDSKVKENETLTGRKKTTYEESLARNRKKAEKYSAAVPTGAQAAKNIKELIFGTPKEGGTINPTISAADFSTRYDKMTAREKAVYSHYKQAGKNKEAADYLKAIEMDVNKRAAAQRTADAKKLAEDSTMGGLYARYMGALTSPLAAAYSLVQDARGEAIDPNSPLFLGEQIRQGQTEGFLGESKGAKKILKEAALGTFDWGSQMATLGALGLGGKALGAGSSAMYGASAFSGNAKDATERGATSEEAVAYGTIGAAAEIITEKLGFERLFKLGKLAKIAGNKGKLAAEILKSMGAEGLEEGTSEAANQIADALIMGDRSQMAEIYMAAKAAGKTEGEAAAAALWDAVKQTFYSAGVGALSGGMIAGGVAGGSRLAGRNVLGEGTAEAEEQTLPTEQTMPSAEQNMPSAEQSAPITEQGTPAAEQTMPITEQTAPMIEQTVPAAEEQPTAEVREMGQQTAERTVSPETQEAESYTKDLQEYSGKYYGAKGQEVYLRKAAETGNLDHTAAFNTYYRAGIAGIAEDEIQPTAYTAAADKLMLNEAWMAGAEDRKAEIANAIRGTSKLTGKRGLIVGEDVKATEGQLAIAKFYVDIGGAKIRLVDELSVDIDGKKQKINGKLEDGVITIALKSDSFMGTTNHEMVHLIRKANPTGYDAMRELVFKLANKSGVDMEKHMAEYEEKYGAAYGEDVKMTDIMEEVVADGFQKIVENEADLKEFLDELSKKDKTLVERIQDFFKKMEETIKALFEDNTYTEFAEDLSRDLENIRQLRKKFAEVLADTGRMEEGEGTAEQTGKGKYAIKYSEENKPFVAIEKDILDGVPRKEWTKKVKETLKKKYPNGIQIRNEYIHVNGRQTASEMTNSKYARWLKINSPAEYADKLRFANNADEILYAAQNWRGEGLHHPRKDSIVEFARADALIRIGERGYSADVVVGTKGNSEMVLYDILYLKSASINEKKQEQTAVHSKKEIPTESAAPVSKNNIAQEEEKNNNRNITKRTDTELKSFGLQSPSGITEYGSETSIEDLLSKVKEKHKDVKFSIRKEDYDLLKEQNIQLKEANDALMQQFEITKEEKVDRASAKKAARRWLEKHDSKFDVEEFAERFAGLYEYAQKVQGQEDFSNVMCALQMLAEEALQKSEALNTDLWDEYAQMRKTIKNTTIKVTEEIKKELDYAGGYNQIRLGNFNLISLSTKKGIAADRFFQELEETYPEFFRQEDVSTQGEMILKIVDVLDSIRPDIYNPYGYDLSGYAMDAAYELFDLFQEVQLQKPTFADKYEKKLKKAREKYRDELIELREDAKEKQKKALLRQRDKLSDQYESWKEKYKERNKRAWEKAKEEAQRDLETAWDSYVRATDRLLEKEFNRKEKEKLSRQKKKWNTHRRQIERDTQAMLKWLAKPTNKYHVPKRYIESLSVILTKLNTSNRGVTLLQSDIQRMLSELTRTKPGEGQDMQYVNNEYDTNIEVYLKKLAIVLERQGGKLEISELTNLQMEWLKNAIAGLRTNLTNTNKLYGTRKKITLQEFSENFIKEAEERRHVAQAGPLRVMGDYFGISMLTPETFLKGVSEEVYQTFWKGYSDGLAKKTLHTEEARKFMNDLISPKEAHKLDSEAPRKIEVEQKDGTKKEVYMTTPQMMYLHCAMRRKQAMLHLIGGEIETEYGVEKVIGSGFTVEPEGKLRLKGRKEVKKALEQTEVFGFDLNGLKQITSLLTDKQKQIAEAMQDFLSTVAAEWGNETSREMYGYDKFGEKHYIPIISNKEYLTAVFGREGGDNRTLQNMGAAQMTNERANNPIVIANIFDIFSRHIDQMSSYNAFVPIMNDTNNFLNFEQRPKTENIGMTAAERAAVTESMTQEQADEWNKTLGAVAENLQKESETDIAETFGEKGETRKTISVRNSLKAILGPKAEEYFNKLMIDINNAAGTDDVGAFSKKMLRNMKVASVGANIRVVVQQPVSVIRAFAVMNPKYLIASIGAGKVDWDMAYRKAPIYLWKEWGGAEMDTGRTLREMITGQGFYENIIGASMWGAGFFDKLTWGRIWKACELETKKKHPELKGDAFYDKVGERANEIIDQTQVVDSVLHRCESMRSKNFFMKMATSFMSEPIKTYNMAYDALREARQNPKSKEAWKKLTRTGFTLVLNGIGVAIAAGFVDAMRDDDDDDEFLEKWKNAVIGDYSEAETFGEKFSAMWASNLNDNLNPMNTMVFARDLYSMISGYDVARTDFSWAADLIDCFKKWMQFMEGESKYTLNGMLRYTAGQFSKLIGLPYKSLDRDLFALKDSVVNHFLKIEQVQDAFGYSEADRLALAYQNRKLTNDIGSQQNVKLYTKMMLEAAFNGDNDLAAKIWNEMTRAGISNEQMQSQLTNAEKNRVRKEPEAAEAVEAYKEKDYDTYTAKMDALREKGYSQKGIEKALSGMYKEKYGEEPEKTFEEISAEYWTEDEEMKREKFQSVIDAMVEEKLSGATGSATKRYNYLVNNGLNNDSVNGAIKTREKKLMKADSLIYDGAKAYYMGDVDGFLSVVDQFQAKHYFTENIYEAIKEKSEQLYGTDDPGTFEEITDEYWEDGTNDTGADNGLLYNAWKNGSSGTYQRMWDILADSGKKNGNIRSTMRGKLKKEYAAAKHKGDYQMMERAAAEYRRLGGDMEKLEG